MTRWCSHFRGTSVEDLSLKQCIGRHRVSPWENQTKMPLLELPEGQSLPSRTQCKMSSAHNCYRKQELMLRGVETKGLGQFMLALGQLEKSNIYRWNKRQACLCKKRWENRVREDHSKEQGMFRRWSTDAQEKPWQSVESRLQREAAGNRGRSTEQARQSLFLNTWF